MNWQPVTAFLSKHQEGLGLFALAMAVTMRPKLPWPFSLIEPLEWLYEWFRDGLLTFVSMRGPAHSETALQKNTTITDADGTKTKKVVVAATSESTAEVPKPLDAAPVVVKTEN